MMGVHEWDGTWTVDLGLAAMERANDDHLKFTVALGRVYAAGGDERPIETAATGIVGATAVLVEVVEELRQTACTVRESRENVVGQLPEVVDAPEACKLLGIVGANPVKALQKRIQRGKTRTGGLVKDGGKLIQFHRDTLRARLAKEGQR